MDSISAIQAITNLGMAETSASVYIDLLASGNSSALEISERTSIARTTIYRALEELENHELVRFDGQNRHRYRAEEYKNLKKLIDAQEKRTVQMSESLPELFGFLLNIAGTSTAATEINHYEGREGLEQVTLNTLAARGTFRAYEMASMNEFLDVDFAEHIRRESMRHKIVSHQICNEKKSGDFTNVTGYVNRFWFLRYMDPKLLPVEVNIWIYNDTVVIYDYKERAFAVEITNEKLARMQRTQFDFIWKQAKKMKFDGTHGAASLI